MQDNNCGCSVAVRTPAHPLRLEDTLSRLTSLSLLTWAGGRGQGWGLCETREKNPGWTWLTQRGQSIGDRKW